VAENGKTPPVAITLKYGKQSISAPVPPGWNVRTAHTPHALPIASPQERLSAFLENPVHCRPFDAVFAEKQSVAVIVPDITRKAGVKTLLPIIMDRLEGLGIPADRLKIVFATGIHSAQTEEQKRQIAGNAMFERYACIEHDCRGEFSDKGGFAINRHVAEADGLVVIGAVKAHYLAGFSGGRKAILPGVSTYGHCLEFHRLCMNPAGPGRHPGVGPGKLAGNPMHEKATLAARSAGVDFLVNTVLDEEENFIFINAGDLETSFAQACRFAAGYQIVPVGQRASAAIVSCGGWPLDINFIQAHKALDAAFGAVKPGGAILLAAECAGGTGNPGFLKWFDYGPSALMEAELRRNFVINGQTAYATREKTEGARVALLSRLGADDARRMGMTPVGSLEEGLAFCEKSAEENADVLVIPDGGLTLPSAE